MNKSVKGFPVSRLNLVDYLNYYGVWSLRLPISAWNDMCDDEDEQDLRVVGNYEYQVGFPRLVARLSHIRAFAYNPLINAGKIVIDLFYSQCSMMMEELSYHEFRRGWACAVDEWAMNEADETTQLEREQALYAVEQLMRIEELAEHVKQVNSRQNPYLARIGVYYINETVDVTVECDGCTSFWFDLIERHVLGDV